MALGVVVALVAGGRLGPDGAGTGAHRTIRWPPCRAGAPRGLHAADVDPDGGVPPATRRREHPSGRRSTWWCGPRTSSRSTSRSPRRPRRPPSAQLATRLGATVVAGVVENVGYRPVPQRRRGLGPGRGDRRPLRQGPPGALRRVHPGPEPLPAPGQPGPGPPRCHRRPWPGSAATRPPGPLGDGHLLRGVLRGPGPGGHPRRGRTPAGADQRLVLPDQPGAGPGGGGRPATGLGDRARHRPGGADGLSAP